MIMAAITSPGTVFFDLDNTLFDHDHSLRSAIAAVRSEFLCLQAHRLEVLIDTYNTALERVYQQYLDKSIAYADTDVMKVKLFFESLQLPEPSPGDISNFRAVYKPAYRDHRRATPGSVEVLVCLREHGYRLAVITNGQAEDQMVKLEAIGLGHLVDRIVTSEEAGYAKPDARIFQKALTAMHALPSTTYMVGDSIASDIKGALAVDLAAILYCPNAPDSRRLLFGTQIPVIHHMSELLAQLRIVPQNSS